MLSAMRFALWLAVSLLASPAARGQFDLEESHVTASLRGIDTAGPGIAWASGSGGTILRTEDAGFLWQPCTTPKGAEKLDFRGVQAFDRDTAIVMSSGPGALSRIYKTTDGCQTWKLVFTNPDPSGFFDAIKRTDGSQLYVLGDPVHGRFALFASRDAGESWSAVSEEGLDADEGDGAFAASNSSLIELGGRLYFGTGGTNAAHLYARSTVCPVISEWRSCARWRRTDVSMASHSASSGVFSLAGRVDDRTTPSHYTLVAVGGTYSKPEEKVGTSATSTDGHAWMPATVAPGGYRSSVAYDRTTGAWIAVGTNGADVSRDDGKTWKPLAPTGSDGPDTARGWNAIALPFVVGGKGRIGRLRPDAIPK